MHNCIVCLKANIKSPFCLQLPYSWEVDSNRTAKTCSAPWSLLSETISHSERKRKFKSFSLSHITMNHRMNSFGKVEENISKRCLWSRGPIREIFHFPSSNYNAHSSCYYEYHVITRKTWEIPKLVCPSLRKVLVEDGVGKSNVFVNKQNKNFTKND